MEEKEFASSDSDDSDFEVNLEEELSEDSEQSDYEGSENESDDAQEESNGKKTKKSKTRRKKSKKSAKKQTRLSNVNEESELNSTQSSDNESNKLTAEQEKERADSLWKSFLNETNTPSKAQSSHTKSTTSSKTETASQDSSKVVNTKQTSTTKTEKVADTKTLDTKETVKLTLKSPLASTNENGNKCKVSPLSVQDSSKKRGLSNFLGNIQKKSKLSTLEKSKLDWNQFKEENNLQEEITTFNRGKDGYLEKQDFLQRTDSRQLELEKEMRHVGRRKAR